MRFLNVRPRRLLGQQRTRIDWGHSVTKDLSYFRVMDSFCPTPLHSRVAQNMVIDGTSTGLRIAGTPNGVGMVGLNQTDWFVDTSNKFNLTANCTMLAYVTPNFAVADGLNHCAISLGQADNDASVECMIHKHTDSKWYLGIYNNGSDNRIILPAAGTYTQYAPLVVGWTCIIGGSTVGWVNGKVLGTSTSPASLPNTAVNKFYIGGMQYTGPAYGGWSRGDGSAVHWIAIWDRVLNDEEIKALSFDPNLFLRETPFFVTSLLPGMTSGTAAGVASAAGVAKGFTGGGGGTANYSLQPPRLRPGKMRINWGHSVTKDLAYFRLMDSLSPTPMFSRAAQNMAISSGASLKIAGAAAGVGMTGNTATDWMVDTSNQFATANSFTVLAYVTPFFSPTDGLSHYIMIDGVNPGANFINMLTLTKYSDNNWYMGILRYGFGVPADYRVITAAAGTYAAGVPMVVGVTGVTGSQSRGWVSGKMVATAANGIGEANYPAGSFFIGGVNDGSNTNNAWARDGASAIHWIAIWDRVLSDEEIRLVSFNPTIFLRTSPPFFVTTGQFTTGHADGVASVDGHVLPTYQGRADGAANVVGVGFQYAFADGVATVIGRTPAVMTTGNADGVANVIGLPAVPVAGYADGVAGVFTRIPSQAAAIIAGI